MVRMEMKSNFESNSALFMEGLDVERAEGDDNVKIGLIAHLNYLKADWFVISISQSYKEVMKKEQQEIPIQIHYFAK